MGLRIQNIPNLPGGNISLISSSLLNGKTIYALAGHGEDLSFATKRSCNCEECESSFLCGHGILVDDFYKEPEDRGSRALMSYIPITVFDIHSQSREILAHYGPRYPYTIVNADFAKSLGHQLTRSSPFQGEKVICLSMTFANPARMATAHVIQCIVVDGHLPGINMILNEKDFETLHSRSEYWARCAVVMRQYQNKAQALLDGSLLQTGGVAKATFHGTDGLQHPTWMVFGTTLSHSEISKHALRLIEPKWQDSPQLVRLKIEVRPGTVNEIQFNPVTDLKNVCLGSGLDKEIMEGFNVSITITDWARLIGLSPPKPCSCCSNNLDYGLFDNVIIENSTGTKFKVCVLFSPKEGIQSTMFSSVYLKFSKLKSLGSEIRWNLKDISKVEALREPDIALGPEDSMELFSHGKQPRFSAQSVPTNIDGFCGFCLEDFTDDIATKSLSCCKGVLHSHCYDDLSQKFEKCPYCRKPFRGL
ncbi:uncharacterized protein Z518_11063 [Rhinocladiella mackenziei CBS 650.93]|uniref:RING-type domain-containing protein n=1 Tax=Rhinocladiella mackenziei CBS 650.93 TaxID=1442369 RepID=A0A0D2I8T4_9EURO|nr:uncharacterized protein Z518_11063 [Rhinocladiella mackenziei CBS 650.93]KIW99650.1 hypothetical protein Z518_11063 [Rhinocladiella mackenziei CBS 650.93]